MNTPTTNRLATEKSPYLLQHATNPVDWYPWGDEAFGKARREDKPVFLSIGYSSCHWCHVMEHESFADAEVAAYLNEHYVCVKLDREERPDIDEIYMNAVQLMRVPGGWPLSVWLTADRKPFMGGTYFPKEAMYGRPGFLDVMRHIAEAWKDPEMRAKIDRSSEQITDAVRQVYEMEEPQRLEVAALDTAFAMAQGASDTVHGGFGDAPKFPSPSSVEMVLRAWHRTGGDEARNIAVKTLDAMARGGIHDHVGGGFHRYATTRDWLVPHFEKMLYDNGQLLSLYAWGYRAFGSEFYAETARDIARWVLAEMTDAQGGFYAAQDADDPGGPEGEGGFYVWDPASIRRLFPDAADQQVLFARFDIREEGNWHERPGKSILQVLKSRAEVARETKLEEAQVKEILSRCTARMYAEREKRPKPMTDTKVLADWNGLMISGLCKGYQALGEQAWLDAAVRAGRFLRTTLTREDGSLIRRWAGGEAAHEGVLSDHAYVVQAYLDLYETTFDADWLRAAIALSKVTVERFYDPKEGGFFYTSDRAEALIARGKSGYDNATPSGNGVMALNLLRLFELTGDPKAKEQARKTLDFFGARVGASALGFSAVLIALDFEASKPRAVFIAGEREGVKPLVEAVWRAPDPNRVLALVTPEIEKLLPPAKGKTASDGKPAAYVCRDFTCAAPVTTPAELAKHLRR